MGVFMFLGESCVVKYVGGGVINTVFFFICCSCFYYVFFLFFFVFLEGGFNPYNWDHILVHGFIEKATDRPL